MRAWNLRGRTVMVTGATSGIGLAAAAALAREGACVVLVGRSEERGNAAIASIRREHPAAQLEFLRIDFSSLAEVRRGALEFLAGQRPLDVLLNNAGVMNTARHLTVDGHEEMFAVNYLAHYLLTRLLLPQLQQSGAARVVHVASNAYAFCPGIRFDDLSLEQGFSAFPAYGHSKLANILFSNELARRLRGSGVTSNALHPGAVATGLGTNNWGMVGRLVPLLIKPFIRSAQKGAATAVHLAASPALEGVTGAYFQDLRAVQTRAAARDRAAEGRLWSVTEQLLKEYLGP
jgi:retinol dehydrogenase 12